MLELFTKKLEELKTQRGTLDAQIDALETAYKALAGVWGDAPAPRKPRASGGKRIVDKQAREKTIAFMYSKKAPVGPEAVAERFNIKYSAANQRLHTLVHDGLAKRVGKGRYMPRDADEMRSEIVASASGGVSSEGAS